MILRHYFKTNKSAYLWLKYKGSKIKAETKISSYGTDTCNSKKKKSVGCRAGGGRHTHLQCVSIQGDSGGICNTLGNDSMCDSKQKSSYEHGSDFFGGIFEHLL